MNKFSFKKFLLLGCMLICIFSMTACGNPQIDATKSKNAHKENLVSKYEPYLQGWAVDMIAYLDSNYDEEGTKRIIDNAENGISLNEVYNGTYIVNQLGINAKTIEFYNSWNSTKEELGRLVTNPMDLRPVVEASDETGKLCTITVKAQYEKRNCTFEFVINDDEIGNYTLESGAINPDYSTGEKMTKAGMNTLIGMGTVFVVLIFISIIISLLKYADAVVNACTAVIKSIKKALGLIKEEENVATTGVDNAIAQIVSNEEQEEDDLELIAVIAAAIAASEGTSPDGLVVRSIRKVNNRR